MEPKIDETTYPDPVVFIGEIKGIIDDVVSYVDKGGDPNAEEDKKYLRTVLRLIALHLDVWLRLAKARSKSGLD